jgi:2-methylcitrate dehydratase PrpD
MAKFARAMALPHYSKGWHSTSALGILGTTTACAVLLGLPIDQTAHALGLAVAQASGSRENFGTMAKSFQSAHGAACSVRAALLARHGMTASDTAIDGPFGFMSLYAAREDISSALGALAKDGLEIDSTGIDIKKYPCCYALHRALDAIMDLARLHGVSAGEVNAVQVMTSAGGLQALMSRPPASGLEAKFSMEFGIACALSEGVVRLASFSDEAVLRADIRQMMAKVHVAEASGDILPRWSQVSLQLMDGTALNRKASIAHGDAGDPLSDEELIRKVEDCFVFGRYEMNARDFANKVFTLSDRPLATVFAPGN